MSSYSTRRISTSEKAAPTCPRWPASSVRTIVLRSAFDRSSSGVFSGSLISGEKRIVDVVARDAVDERLCLGQLQRTPFRTGVNEPFGEEIVQQDDRPFEAEQRIDDSRARGEQRNVGEQRLRLDREAPLERVGQLHGWAQEK